MASLSTSLPKPSFQHPNTSINLPDHLHNSCLVPRNLSFQRLGLISQHGLFGKMKIARCSHQAEALVDSNTQISDVPILTCSEAFERLKKNRENQKGKQQFLAMYSSIFGGITTDTSAMVIPLDDHMVHRGHGVFDTAAIVDGHLYEFDQHLDRILRSASLAKINLPFDRENIRRILIQTVSASKCKTGSLRYWLSAGPGDFQLSPSDCHQPALYAIVIQDQSPRDSRGIKVVTSSVPIKPPQFATVKSVNYLPNALSKMEAEENGAYASIWLDNDGFVAEGPSMNVAFVTKEKDLLMPAFDKILSGCTAKRVLTLAEGLVKEGKLHGIKIDDVTVEEGKKADEMMLIGSGVLVRPVVQWDNQVIGDGKEGPITRALLALILEDMKSGPPAVRVPVP
ncbi:PREDICTED: D-amino-acid transaminase, chloroplastic-like isoform X1 [Populus euphratica]|uniref:D-amino-acid transaminase, chloroplastic-like isoform X1 n=1 Tax=Populus euphratica TaxID=75702 RepID=A0AAJ6UC09_POPEU|nr:PREDICTED: D-amino-acid transaminase, chloroplastic-like isoform X1 [Populus euphratica]